MAKLDCGHNEHAGCTCHREMIKEHQHRVDAENALFVKLGKDVVAKQKRWNAMGMFERFGVLLTGRDY